MNELIKENYVEYFEETLLLIERLNVEHIPEEILVIVIVSQLTIKI